MGEVIVRQEGVLEDKGAVQKVLGGEEFNRHDFVQRRDINAMRDTPRCEKQTRIEGATAV